MYTKFVEIKKVHINIEPSTMGVQASLHYFQSTAKSVDLISHFETWTSNMIMIIKISIIFVYLSVFLLYPSAYLDIQLHC